MEEVNIVQDYLLNALSEKKRCAFKGSAGSGKTFIAMKKALLNYRQNIKTLFLCYNFNLSDSIRSYLSEKIGKPYRDIEEKICVYTINKFLYILIDQLIPDNVEREILRVYLGKFKYKELMNKTPGIKT